MESNNVFQSYFLLLDKKCTLEKKIIASSRKNDPLSDGSNVSLLASDEQQLPFSRLSTGSLVSRESQNFRSKPLLN